MDGQEWNSVSFGEEEKPRVEMAELRALAASLDPEDFDEPVQSFLDELMSEESAEPLGKAATLLLQDEVDFSPELAELGVEPDRELLTLLIAAGADVNALNAYGLAPLHLAARYGYGEIVEMLLEAGARVSLASRDGRLAADMAASPELAARLSSLLPERDLPLPPEIEDADAVADSECRCGGHHHEGEHECRCGGHHHEGEHECRCGGHHHEGGHECHCGGHHHDGNRE